MLPLQYSELSSFLPIVLLSTLYLTQASSPHSGSVCKGKKKNFIFKTGFVKALQSKKDISHLASETKE